MQSAQRQACIQRYALKHTSGFRRRVNGWIRDARIAAAPGDAYFVLFKCRGVEDGKDGRLGVPVGRVAAQEG